MTTSSRITQPISIRWMLVIALSLVLSGCSEFIPGGNAAFDQDTYNSADAKRGGLLYDKWWTTKGQQSPPTGTHPIWNERDPDSKASSDGGASWRCKSCHGWDYEGAQGAYSRLLNPDKFTGFPGLIEKRIDSRTGEEWQPEALFAYISNGETSDAFGKQSHAFARYLNNQDLHDITKFVIEYGFNNIGDPNNGSATLGSSPYQRACTGSTCHDSSQKLKDIAIDVARANPEEFIHKAQFGQPGTAMGLAPLASGLTEAKNILAYLKLGGADPGDGDFNPSMYAQADLANGGLLYDKWWEAATQKTPPATIHPLWPQTVNPDVSASSSWRCKQCHGWDYLGKDGAYASGGNYSGHKGIIPSTTTPVLNVTAGNVYNFLKSNAAHGFVNMFTESELYDLTLFVMTMREDAAAGKSAYQYIQEKRVRAGMANAERGKALYHGDSTTSTISLCSTCHGDDGKTIDFADGVPGQGNDKFVGDVALDNPWEFIHKVRFGDLPGDGGIPMPALANNADPQIQQTQAAVHILAYAQENLATEINTTRAGRLYDNWAVEASVAGAPTTTNPIWTATGNTKKTGATTWRCKSCHGWDYLGRDGAYGDINSSYYTNIKGLMTRIRNDKTSIADYIRNGNADHAFGTYLNDADIDLLADFILGTNNGIQTFETELALANENNGRTLYLGGAPSNCLACHGEDGALQATPIGDVARTNVQEFLHKVRFGHPGSNMKPEAGAGFEGLTPQQSADVYAYTKTLGQTATNPSYENASLVRGGRLYDKWWEEMTASDATIQPPAQVNPLWLIRSSNIPDIADTPSNPNKRTQYSWRCKTCHGWDYEGIGFNSGTKSAFGADNLLYKLELIKNDAGLPTPEQKQQYVFNWIKFGLSTELHNFGSTRAALPSALSDADVWDLVKFLMEGTTNTDTYIYETFKTVKGPYKNLDNGKGLYAGSIDPAINCASCHGEDGMGVVGQGAEGVDIFAIAIENPWEFLHKVRFGQPNSQMPAFLNPNSEHTTIHALHVLDYAQDQYNLRPVVAIEID